jgi:L-fuculose-phosphate aldolase
VPPCLLANHGQIWFGIDLDKAIWLAHEIETLCQQYWAACLAGDPVVLTDDEQMSSVLRRFKTYGRQPKELREGDALAVIAPQRRDASNARRSRQ